MAEMTGIAWTDATFNPWIGCTKVGPGCDGCYAAVSTPARALGVVWGPGQQRRRTSESNWRKPLQWNARPFVECMACGWRGEARETSSVMNPAGFHIDPDAVLACPKCAALAIKEARRRVFCASLADVFDNEVPDEWRGDLWGLIASTPNLDWLLLTKRIGNAAKMLPGNRATGAVLPNIWLGATVVNQPEADRDLPKLLATPAAKRFVSYEPALGPVDWRRHLEAQAHERDCPPGYGVHWIIVGGESAQPGHPARPFDIAWARDTVRQCREAGVAVFVKQLGSNPLDVGCAPGCIWTTPNDIDRLKDRAGADPAEWPQDLRVRQFPC